MSALRHEDSGGPALCLQRDKHRVGPDGRGTLFTQFKGRKFKGRTCFMTPTALHEQFPEDFPLIPSNAHKLVNIDTVDLANVSPFLAHALVRVGGCSIPFSQEFSISHVTIMPTVPHNVLPIDEFTLFRNSLYCEWDGRKFGLNPNWLQENVRKYRPELIHNFESITDSWRHTLGGKNELREYEFKGVKGLRNTPRERLAVVIRILKLQDANTPELDVARKAECARRVLLARKVEDSLNRNFGIDRRTQLRLDKWWKSSEPPKYADGSDITANSSPFKEIDMLPRDSSEIRCAGYQVIGRAGVFGPKHYNNLKQLLNSVVIEGIDRPDVPAVPLVIQPDEPVPSTSGIPPKKVQQVRKSSKKKVGQKDNIGDKIEPLSNHDLLQLRGESYQSQLPEEVEIKEDPGAPPPGCEFLYTIEKELTCRPGLALGQLRDPETDTLPIEKDKLSDVHQVRLPLPAPIAMGDFDVYELTQLVPRNTRSSYNGIKLLQVVRPENITNQLLRENECRAAELTEEAIRKQNEERKKRREEKLARGEPLSLEDRDIEVNDSGRKKKKKFHLPRNAPRWQFDLHPYIVQKGLHHSTNTFIQSWLSDDPQVLVDMYLHLDAAEYWLKNSVLTIWFYEKPRVAFEGMDRVLNDKTLWTTTPQIVYHNAVLWNMILHSISARRQLLEAKTRLLDDEASQDPAVERLRKLVMEIVIEEGHNQEELESLGIEGAANAKDIIRDCMTRRCHPIIRKFVRGQPLFQGEKLFEVPGHPSLSLSLLGKLLAFGVDPDTYADVFVSDVPQEATTSNPAGRLVLQPNEGYASEHQPWLKEKLEQRLDDTAGIGDPFAGTIKLDKIGEVIEDTTAGPTVKAEFVPPDEEEDVEDDDLHEVLIAADCKDWGVSQLREYFEGLRLKAIEANEVRKQEMEREKARLDEARKNKKLAKKGSNKRKPKPAASTVTEADIAAAVADGMPPLEGEEDDDLVSTAKPPSLASSQPASQSEEDEESSSDDSVVFQSRGINPEIHQDEKYQREKGRAVKQHYQGETGAGNDASSDTSKDETIDSEVSMEQHPHGEDVHDRPIQTKSEYFEKRRTRNIDGVVTDSEVEGDGSFDLDTETGGTSDESSEDDDVDMMGEKKTKTVVTAAKPSYSDGNQSAREFRADRSAPSTSTELAPACSGEVASTSTADSNPDISVSGAEQADVTSDEDDFPETGLVVTKPRVENQSAQESEEHEQQPDSDGDLPAVDLTKTKKSAASKRKSDDDDNVLPAIELPTVKKSKKEEQDKSPKPLEGQVDEDLDWLHQQQETIKEEQEEEKKVVESEGFVYISDRRYKPWPGDMRDVYDTDSFKQGDHLKAIYEQATESRETSSVGRPPKRAKGEKVPLATEAEIADFIEEDEEEGTVYTRPRDASESEEELILEDADPTARNPTRKRESKPKGGRKDKKK